MSRFVILTGPSCAGKTPLVRALQRFHPDLLGPFQPVVLWNSRDPRPDETNGEQYRFCDREDIERRRDTDGYSVFDVRGDLQALDEKELSRQLREGDVLYEGNPFVARHLLELAPPPEVQRVGIFIAPLSKAELEALGDQGADLEAVVADVMRRKLFRRARRMQGVPSQDEMEDINQRAESAWQEFSMVAKFDHVVVNHDGEDSENWTAWPVPLGDAFRTMEEVAEILRNMGHEEMAGVGTTEDLD